RLTQGVKLTLIVLRKRHYIHGYRTMAFNTNTAIILLHNGLKSIYTVVSKKIFPIRSGILRTAIDVAANDRTNTGAVIDRQHRFNFIGSRAIGTLAVAKI